MKTALKKYKLLKKKFFFKGTGAPTGSIWDNLNVPKEKKEDKQANNKGEKNHNITM